MAAQSLELIFTLEYFAKNKLLTATRKVSVEDTGVVSKIYNVVWEWLRNPDLDRQLIEAEAPKWTTNMEVPDPLNEGGRIKLGDENLQKGKKLYFAAIYLNGTYLHHNSPKTLKDLNATPKSHLFVELASRKRYPPGTLVGPGQVTGLINFIIVLDEDTVYKRTAQSELGDGGVSDTAAALAKARLGWWARLRPKNGSASGDIGETALVNALNFYGGVAVGAFMLTAGLGLTFMTGGIGLAVVAPTFLYFVYRVSRSKIISKRKEGQLKKDLVVQTLMVELRLSFAAKMRVVKVLLGADGLRIVCLGVHKAADKTGEGIASDTFNFLSIRLARLLLLGIVGDLLLVAASMNANDASVQLGLVAECLSSLVLQDKEEWKLFETFKWQLQMDEIKPEVYRQFHDPRDADGKVLDDKGKVEALAKFQPNGHKHPLRRTLMARMRLVLKQKKSDEWFKTWTEVAEVRGLAGNKPKDVEDFVKEMDVPMEGVGGVPKGFFSAGYDSDSDSARFGGGGYSSMSDSDSDSSGSPRLRRLRRENKRLRRERRKLKKKFGDLKGVVNRLKDVAHS